MLLDFPISIGKLACVIFTAACFSVFGGVGPTNMIGSGEPGLKIIYKGPDQFVVFLGNFLMAGPTALGDENNWKVRIIADQNYGLVEKLRDRSLHDFPEQLYAFDQQTAFTCSGGEWSRDFKAWEYWPRETRVFSTNIHGLFASNDVYALARKNYGLTTNQLFLGRIGENIFFWQTNDPHRAYCRQVNGTNSLCYFQMPAGVIDIYGVTKVVAGNDDQIGFVTFGKSPSFFSDTPFTCRFIKMSLIKGRK